MRAAPSISLFHQWLLAAVPVSPAACSIILHGTRSDQPNSLALGIASYLNEYDDDGDGWWLAVPQDLIPLIAGDPSYRRLLALDGETHHANPNMPFGTQRTIAALAALGHVVLDSPLAAAATRTLDNVFHVGVGLPPDHPAQCHIILNPDLFQIDCLPQIIGDVFLEWFNSRCRNIETLHEV